MMRSVTLAFFLALLPALSLATEAITRYTYAEGGIFPIRTGLGIATTIELDPTDPVLDYSTGFSGGWEIVRREHLFYIKPKNVDVDTNMLVRTQRRSYIFPCRSAPPRANVRMHTPVSPATARRTRGWLGRSSSRPRKSG